MYSLYPQLYCMSKVLSYFIQVCGETMCIVWYVTSFRHPARNSKCKKGRKPTMRGEDVPSSQVCEVNVAVELDSLGSITDPELVSFTMVRIRPE